jgi:curved DNA-binding protein CbpA
VDTFELLPSLAQGELAETSAPEIVAAVFRSRASGTLWLETPDAAEIRMFFRAGDMCGSGSFAGFRTLAHVVLENDWVNVLDIDSSREEASASKTRHGEVLVAKGLLTPEKLRDALALQHTGNLTTLLGFTEGRYDWRGWEPPPAWAREVSVDPVSCLVDALEQEKHAARRQHVLSWLGSNAARISLDWPELQGRVALAPLDRRAAALLALPRKLKEFVQASRLEPARAEALLVTLLLCGGVEPQPVAAGAVPAPVDSQEAAPLEGEPILEPLQEEEELPPLVAEPEEEELPPLVAAPEHEELLPEPDLQPERLSHRPRRAAVEEDEAFARLDSLSLDELKPTPPGPPQVTEESLELEFDPRERAPAPVGGQTARPAGEELTLDTAQDDRARDMRKKMVARGMRNLGNMPAQAREEVAAQAPAPALDESQLDAEEQRFVDDVRSRVRQLPTQNAYARLGVSPSASSEAIKNAYLQAAKRYHPDRAVASLAGLAAELQAVFTALKESLDSLATPELRAKYDQQLKAGGAPKPSSRRDEAALSLKMGEALLKKRDFDGALSKIRRAVDLDASGDALAALAWALVSDPKATAQTKEEAASLINRALRAEGATARTYYVAGVLWRTKDPDSAVDAFRKALEIDPHHSDAALELRLIEQRRGKPQKSGGGVLSGLLFGKRKPS